ncbi:MAG TPA: hypothetical protein VL863_09255 [bacterium]|nr:hypothetical protein [bacterium]
MKPLAPSNVLPLAAAALMVFALAGCGRDSVKVYKVETNDTTMTLPPAAGSGAMPSMMPGGVPVPDNSGLPKLKYTLPDGWKEKALTQLRVASFEITADGKQADVSVIPLGGMAGGDFANVNRWRGQVGLSTITEEEVQKLAEKIEAAGQPADLYDIAGTSPGSGDESRIIATILHRDDTAWFFKMTGDGALVEKNKAAFIAFLKSVEFGAPSAPSQLDMSQQLPPSHPAIPGMDMSMGGSAPVAATEAGDKPTWTVPDGWQEGQLAQFLVAKYVIAGAGDAKAEVNVSSLSGDGGGLLANINRWRAQLGVAPVTEADIANLPTIDAAGGKATVVDISGTNPRTGTPAQLIGVVLPLGGQTWFYKLMGDAAVVAAQKDALMKFVQSAKYP